MKTSIPTALLFLIIGVVTAGEADAQFLIRIQVTDTYGNPIQDALLRASDGTAITSGTTDSLGRVDLSVDNREIVFITATADRCDPLILKDFDAAKDFLLPYFIMNCESKPSTAIGDAAINATNPLELGGQVSPGHAVATTIVLGGEVPPSTTRVASILLFGDASGLNEGVAVANDTEIDLGLALQTEVGDSHMLISGQTGAGPEAQRPAASSGGTIAFPLITQGGLLPTVRTVAIDPDGTAGATSQQVLSTFTASSADSLPRPETGTSTRKPEVVFGWREQSSFVTYEATSSAPGAAEFTFDRALVPSIGLLGAFDGGYQTEFVVQPTSTAADPTVWNFGSFFSEIASLTPSQSCPQPFADEGMVMLHGWKDTDLRHTEELYPINGTFGFGCAPPAFTAGSAADEMGIFATTDGGRLTVVSKRLTKPNVGAQILDMGQIPATGGPLITPASLADGMSGSVVFGVPGDDLYGWSDDSSRLGQDPWPLRDIAEDVQLDQGFPFELSSNLGGNQGYLVGRFLDSQINGTGGKPGASTVLGEIPLDGCLSTDGAVCLNNNRFSVRAHYELKNGDRGDGHARPLSNDSGTFWFFDKGNRELIVKLLDGCGVNGHYWFFAAGLTDVGVQLTVVDEQNGEGRVYFNPVGTQFQPILQTDTFPCSAADTVRAEAQAKAPKTERFPRREGRVLRADGEEFAKAAHLLSDPDPNLAHAGLDTADLATTAAACGGAANALCLAGNRFRVEVDFSDFSGGGGSAFGGNLTDDTAALFFFDPANVEMLVKVLDACAINDRFWLFSGALTNVGVTMTVTDTQTGVSKRFENTLGDPFSPISDTQTFSCSN